MPEIEMHTMTPEFARCWRAAGMHLNNQVSGGIQSWIRADPYPPFLEHLSFRLGNQLFFIHVVDVTGEVRGPGSLKGLYAVAQGNRGHACLLPMTRNRQGSGWTAAEPGWGLIDADTRAAIDPVSLVSDKKIEMTPWEIQDMAVQVVRGYLTDEGFKLMSWQSNPQVDPALWFIGASAGPEWVVVRAVTFPENQASRPSNWEAIARRCARQSSIGHFASVAIVNAEQPFKSDSEPAVPLWRGHGMHVRFAGLE